MTATLWNSRNINQHNVPILSGGTFCHIKDLVRVNIN